MPVEIGPPGDSSEDAEIDALLLACHARIRDFSGLARRLAEAREASPETLRDAAARVRRYFSEALPLHVADEEETVLPRLAGRDAELDAALERMRREHGEHEPHLAAVLEACGRVEADLGALDALRPALAEAAARLEAELAAHLDAEERVILPAIRSLAPSERSAMRDELRARRR